MSFFSEVIKNRSLHIINLDQRWNSEFEDKLLIWGDVSTKCDHILKRLSRERNITIEKKGMLAEVCDNTLRFMIVSPPRTDFTHFKCADIKLKVFDVIHRDMNNGGIHELAHYLLNREIE